MSDILSFEHLLCLNIQIKFGLKCLIFQSQYYLLQKKKHISILKKGVLKAFGAFGFTEPNF